MIDEQVKKSLDIAFIINKYGFTANMVNGISAVTEDFALKVTVTDSKFKMKIIVLNPTNPLTDFEIERRETELTELYHMAKEINQIL